MISIHCPHCHEKTRLSVAQAQGGVPAVWLKNQSVNWWIGICNGCQEPCLACNSGAVIYPHPKPTPTEKDIPNDLRNDLDEAKLCLSINCFRACAVMSRRCIQQACIEKGCKPQSNLVAQISELTQLSQITKDIEEWATVVRWVGNDAAHTGGNAVSKEEAEDILKLTEQFLHVLFVTPALAKARRAKMGK